MQPVLSFSAGIISGYTVTSGAIVATQNAIKKYFDFGTDYNESVRCEGGIVVATLISFLLQGEKTFFWKGVSTALPLANFVLSRQAGIRIALQHVDPKISSLPEFKALIQKSTPLDYLGYITMAVANISMRHIPYFSIVASSCLGPFLGVLTVWSKVAKFEETQKKSA